MLKFTDIADEAMKYYEVGDSLIDDASELSVAVINYVGRLNLDLIPQVLKQEKQVNGYKWYWGNLENSDPDTCEYYQARIDLYFYIRCLSLIYMIHGKKFQRSCNIYSESTFDNIKSVSESLIDGDESFYNEFISFTPKNRFEALWLIELVNAVDKQSNLPKFVKDFIINFRDSILLNIEFKGSGTNPKTYQFYIEALNSGYYVEHYLDSFIGTTHKLINMDDCEDEKEVTINGVNVKIGKVPNMLIHNLAYNEFGVYSNGANSYAVELFIRNLITVCDNKNISYSDRIDIKNVGVAKLVDGKWYFTNYEEWVKINSVELSYNKNLKSYQLPYVIVNNEPILIKEKK